MPEAGFEPARISPHAPQTCVSASSTTPARGGTEQSIVCAGCESVNAPKWRSTLTPAERRAYAPFDGRVPLRRALRAREGRDALPQALVGPRRGERVPGPGGPEGRPRGAPPRRAPGVPRRRLPLSPGPPRAARRRARRPRGVRERQERRAVAAAQRRGRGRLRAADVPGHGHRHDRRRRRASASSPAAATRSTCRAASTRPTRARTCATRRACRSRCTTRQNSGHEPARADRRLRDGRHGVPLPDARQGRRLREQDVPVPGDARASSTRRAS